MKTIRNVSRAELQFIGGNLLPDEEATLPDAIADRLLRRNPVILTEVRIEALPVVEDVKIEAVEIKEEVKEDVKPVIKSRRKRK